MGLALPPEWTFDTAAVGGPATITLPGVSNISHVLTFFEMEIVDVGAGALYNPIVQLLDGVNVISSWFMADFTPGPGAQIVSLAKDCFYPITPGNALTLRFNIAMVGTEQNITIRGYDA